MIEIPLTQGKVTQVDDEFEYLGQYKWYANKVSNKASFRYYAARNAHLNDTKTVIRMHRVIMEIKLGRLLLRNEEIDHVDHNGLNNTINNLRIATSRQNSMNSRKQNRITYSKYIGVTWHKRTSKWYAQIQKNKKVIYLGYFTSEEDAAHARDTAAKLYFGKYANLNFPEIP